MMLLKEVIIILICFYTEVQTAKILAVFPMPSISHQVVFRKITQELINRGHEVTVITPDPAYAEGKAPSNLTEIDVHDVSYSIWQKTFQEKYTVEELKAPKFSELRQGFLLFAHMFKYQIQSPKIQNLIRDKNEFDLLLIEAVFRPALVFSHIFKAPVILISSMGAVFNNHDVMGSPTHPFLYPSSFRTRLYNLTLAEKLHELYIHYLYEYITYLNEVEEIKMLREAFGPEVPPMNQLFNNVDMLFINLHPIWADNQPVPPGVLYMGGIHQLPEKDLPEDLKSYLDSSKNGVIYVSFGTNVLAGMIPHKKVEIIARVLSSLPYDVLWKWDKEELPGKSDNIKISKWFPQSDLLRHPKIKLFITQAGLQSTDEAITGGVPLIAMPMLGDQWFNAEKYEKLGIGMNLNIETLNKDTVKFAVENVINNSSYRQKIQRLKTFLQDQPETPLQRTMWWIEYVIRHRGAKQLRAAGANISYYEYFSLDVILALLLVVLFILILIGITILFIFKIITKLLSQNMNQIIKKKN